jgi:hypothetical protein
MVTGTRAFTGDAIQIVAAKRRSEQLVIPQKPEIDPKLAP